MNLQLKSKATKMSQVKGTFLIVTKKLNQTLLRKKKICTTSEKSRVTKRWSLKKVIIKKMKSLRRKVTRYKEIHGQSLLIFLQRGKLLL